MTDETIASNGIKSSRGWMEREIIPRGVIALGMRSDHEFQSVHRGRIGTS